MIIRQLQIILPFSLNILLIILVYLINAYIFVSTNQGINLLTPKIMNNTLNAITLYAMGLQPEQIARLLNMDIQELAQLVSKYITF